MTRIRLLGPVDVVPDGGTAGTGGPDGGPDGTAVPVVVGLRRKALLAVLALDVGRPVGLDTIVDAVWGDDPPATAANTVQSHVSYLRRVLGSRAAVVAQPPGYRLDTAPDDVDAHRAERLVGEAAGREPADAVRLLGEALALWRGAPLADVADLPAFDAAAARLAELRLLALERSAAARLALGEGADLVPDLERLAAAHPLRERLVAQLMQALFRAGRQADALQVARELRHRLVEELGVEPGDAVREAERAVLNQDPALLAPARRERAPLGRRALPGAATSFVGREREASELPALLGTGGVVTLTGPGGSGKTRLAVEVARRVAPGLADGAVVVDLSDVPGPGAGDAGDLADVPGPGAGDAGDGGPVAAALAAELRVTPEPDVPVAETLRAVLRDRELLVVLDNCESALAPAARLAEALVADGGRLQVLATSREPLRAEGERVLRLGPLPLPPPGGSGTTDALTLLEDRARAVDPGFRLTGLDAAARADAVELCRALDGLPLALELAGARLHAFSPRELLDALDGRFTALGEGRRTAPVRQRGLGATLAWSYDLLPAAEQRAFRRMGAVLGGAGVGLASRMCGAPDAVSLLASLVEKSLVVRTATPSGSRFRLHETGRRYAASLLDEHGERPDAARAHAGAVAEVVADLAPRLYRGGPAALEALGAEDANVTAALDWACRHDPPLASGLVASLWWYWFRTDRAACGLARAEAALAAQRAGAGRPDPAALAGAGYLAWVVDDYRRAGDLADEALSDSGAGDVVHALAFGVQARVLGDTGDFRAAAERALAGVRLHESAGDDWGAAWARRCYASALVYGGDVARGLAASRASRDAFAAFGDDWGAAGSAILMSACHARSGEHAAAVELARDAVALHRRLGDSSGTRYALQHLAEAHQGAGDGAAARVAATEALAVANDHGFRTGALLAELLLAEIARDAGDAAARTRSASAALRLADALRNPDARARARELLDGPDVRTALPPAAAGR